MRSSARATSSNALDVLAQGVGVMGVFADWPATVSFYANCMGLK
jgi:glycerophosphoryl diester phosphodiesterase